MVGPTMTANSVAPNLSDTDPSSANNTLKVKHRSSKPILAWVQRKFASAGRDPVQNQLRSRESTIEARGPDVSRNGSQRRRTINPVDTGYPPRQSTNGSTMRKKAVTRNQSANGEGLKYITTTSTQGQGNIIEKQAVNGSDSAPPSPRSGSLSLSMAAPGSNWSNPPEADDDASIRPLPPTSPPSPAPSRSTHHTISSYTSGGYLSDPKTFRSGAASTKPTTLLSIEVGPATGHAHIAQGPPSTGTGTGASPTFGAFVPAPRFNQGPSSTSITFSTPRHPLANQVAESEPELLEGVDTQPNPEMDNSENTLTQAPRLSHHHPSNNPRPTSPPMDNASTFTLASSTYARPGYGGVTPSIASRLPGTSLAYSGGYRGGGASALGVDDADASVRALRPRSRRGSWASSVQSGETGWSAALHALGPATRRTGGVGSMRTADDGDGDEDASVRHAGMEDDAQTTVEGEVEGKEPAENAELKPTEQAAASSSMVEATPVIQHANLASEEGLTEAGKVEAEAKEVPAADGEPSS